MRPGYLVAFWLLVMGATALRVEPDVTQSRTTPTSAELSPAARAALVLAME